MADDLDELEYRVNRLEQLLYQSNEEDNNEEEKISNEEFVAWDKLKLLEKQVSNYERMLNSTPVAEQAIGSKCLVYSTAENKWVEAEIESKPTLDTMIVSFSGGKKKEDCDKLRPLGVDFHAMTRAEDILQQLIQTCLPPSNDIESDISYPYAIPLSKDAQRVIVQQAEVCVLIVAVFQMVDNI